MTSIRNRRSALSKKASDVNSVAASSFKDNTLLGFSDDEDILSRTTTDRRGPESVKVSGNSPSKITNDYVPDGISKLRNNDSDEMEEDLSLFNKTVQISDLDKIDHAELLRRMHDRFKKKVEKWEKFAHSFARYAFLMNFTILVLQLVQMILHQASNIWTIKNKEIMKGESGSFFEGLRSYKLSEWSKARETSGYWGDLLSAFVDAVFTREFMQTVHGLITALTALIAGLQLKLKLSEKAERYRKGAKIYGRLLRISSYYLMLIESGGKVDDVTGLWREAMRKEEKWIPLVRSYVTV